MPMSPFTHAHNSAFPQSSQGFPWRQHPDDGRRLSQHGAGKPLMKSRLPADRTSRQQLQQHAMCLLILRNPAARHFAHHKQTAVELKLPRGVQTAIRPVTCFCRPQTVGTRPVTLPPIASHSKPAYVSCTHRPPADTWQLCRRHSVPQPLGHDGLGGCIHHGSILGWRL